jgi:ElaB/YqjD/DUF883 family membrane-anchored ribosome-binding protein
MADNGSSENVKNPKESVQEIGREAYRQADNARREAVKQLYEVAATIRSKASQAEGDTRDNANRVARNLEQTANYLNSRAVDQIEETTETLRDNVWKTTAIVFLIGFVLGLILGRKD